MKLLVFSKNKNWLPWISSLFLIAGLIIIHIRLYQFAFDDAYIHFRVARALFETGAPYFNTGEAVKVSTSSGWTIFITIIFAISRLFRIENHFPLLVGITNALIIFCGMIVFTQISETILKKPVTIRNKILFQIPYLAILLPASLGLMETPLALLLAGLGIYLLLLSKPLGFTVLGLAVYIRLELLILLMLASLFIFVTRQQRLQTIIGYAAIGLAPFVIYDLYYFHTVIPNSMVAKSAIYTLQWFIPFLVVLLNSLPTSPLGNSMVGLVFIGTIGLSIVTTTAIAAIKDWKTHRSFWIALFWLWGILIATGYILGHAYIFEWYMPLYAVPLLVACYLSFNSGDRPRKIFTMSMLLILCVISVVSLTRTVYSSASNPSAYDQFESGSRVQLYLKIGSILNEDYPNAALLTSEIGGLGYSFRGRILDAAGLASPEAIKYHPMKVPEERAGYDLGAIPPGYVKETTPELIVSYDTFAQALLNHDEIISQYNMILIPAYPPEDSNYSKSKTIWDSKYLRIYIRKDLPIAERIYDLGK